MDGPNDTMPYTGEIMRIAVVVNCFIGAVPGEPNGFDHPTPLATFGRDATLPATVESLGRAARMTDDSIVLYVFAVAINGRLEFDEAIRSAVRPALDSSGLAYRLITNGDIRAMAEMEAEDARLFFSAEGYPEIRNLGFIVPVRDGADVVVQVDDDELVPDGYLKAVSALVRAHPDKGLFTAPYEKNGTTRITAVDDLASWPKFSSMDRDMERLAATRGPVQTLFGFGGNMVVSSAFARSVFHPLGVPRGEDFSLLLVARILYANGAADGSSAAPGGVADVLEPGDPRLVAWFVNDADMTIDHRPPSEANRDFLSYLEKNLRRFVLEWFMLRGQEALTADDLLPLSSYIHAMLSPDDFAAKIAQIYAELTEQASSGRRDGVGVDAIRASEARMIEFYDEQAASPSRYEEYLSLRERWMSLFYR